MVNIKVCILSKFLMFDPFDDRKRPKIYYANCVGSCHNILLTYGVLTRFFERFHEKYGRSHIGIDGCHLGFPKVFFWKFGFVILPRTEFLLFSLENLISRKPVYLLRRHQKHLKIAKNITESERKLEFARMKCSVVSLL